MKKQSRLADLVNKNREEILKDDQAMKMIEKRIDDKHTKPNR